MQLVAGPPQSVVDAITSGTRLAVKRSIRTLLLSTTHKMQLSWDLMPLAHLPALASGLWLFQFHHTLLASAMRNKLMKLHLSFFSFLLKVTPSIVFGVLERVTRPITYAAAPREMIVDDI